MRLSAQEMCVTGSEFRTLLYETLRRLKPQLPIHVRLVTV